jgi:hypothetical protein
LADACSAAFRDDKGCELSFSVMRAIGKPPPIDSKIKPTGRLLGACSGWRPMGYRFSLLTLLFSGVVGKYKPGGHEKLRGLM